MDNSNETLLKSGMRSFSKAFCGAAGLLIGVFVIVFLFLVFFGNKTPGPSTEIVIAADAEGNRTMLPHSAPVILRINIHGVIGMDKLLGKNIEMQLMDSQGVMIKKDRVKGVLLHINTPGGTVTDADQMYRALNSYSKRFNVPVYAFVDGMCASGGMYVASSAEKIYASPVSVVGSVGVLLGPNFNVVDLMQKVGVKAKTLTRGIDKDMLSPFREWKPGEDKSLQDIIDYQYNRFVDIVTSARPRLNKNALVNTYGAQIYDAPKAEELGYIDEANSDYGTALKALCEKAGIPESKPYQVIELMPQRMFFADLIEGKAFGMDKLKNAFDPNLSNKLMYLYDNG